VHRPLPGEVAIDCPECPALISQTSARPQTDKKRQDLRNKDQCQRQGHNPLDGLLRVAEDLNVLRSDAGGRWGGALTSMTITFRLGADLRMSRKGMYFGPPKLSTSVS